MSNTDFDYLKAKMMYVLDNELWDKKNEKLKEEVYDVYGIRNEKHSETGGTYNGEFYVSGFTTKKPKPPKLTNCRICFKKLLGNRREYCSDNCKQQYRELKKERFLELKEKNPNLNMVFWNQEDNPNGKLEWKKIKGVENKTKYKIIKKIVTKKKGKPINKDMKGF
ncbi:MAG: hypothetical protein IIB80_00660 [Thaumarchaeota archaeon]|nr:hypothetical protein [Nitrososphaerota archaeon]